MQNDDTENLRSSDCSVELLPCPFCGGSAVLNVHAFNHRAWVECCNRDCMLWNTDARYVDAKAAVNVWNSRSETWLERKIVEDVTAWGQHFGIDTSCVNSKKEHPIWQQLWSLLTSLV